MEDAIAYLSETDEAAAEAKTDVEREDYRADAIKDAVFLRSGGNVAERNAIANTHPEHQSAKDKYFAALQRYETMRNKRATESIVVEAWRSVNSNRRQGQ
jgi:hypothetical protein